MSTNKITKEQAYAAIEGEAELPGEMPEEMWNAIRQDKALLTLALRTAVRETKNGIRERIEQIVSCKSSKIS